MEMETLLHKIQSIETDMLRYLLKISQREHVNIYLWGGSLLGAVRHQNFIPWDDDLDVVMERKDFAQLKEGILRNPDERYELIVPEDSTEFISFIPMLTYKNSYLGSCGPVKGEHTRIHLDIFLLDKTADQKWKRTLHSLMLRACYGFALAHRSGKEFSKRFDFGLVEYASAKSLSVIGRCIPYRMVMKMQLAVAQHYNARNTHYMMCTNNAPICLTEKHAHPTAIYHEVKWVPFGSIKAPIMSGYDTLLKSGYGDYMQMPPPEKRRPAHILDEKVVIDDQTWSCKEAEKWEIGEK